MLAACTQHSIPSQCAGLMSSKVPIALAGRPPKPFLPEWNCLYGRSIPNVSPHVTSNEKAACWLRGISPTVQLPDGSEKPFVVSEDLGSFTGGTSWPHSCSLGVCHVGNRQQSSLPFKDGSRAGGRAAGNKPSVALWWLQQLGCARSQGTQNATFLWPLLPAVWRGSPFRMEVLLLWSL